MSRSPAADRLVTAAILYFAQHPYEGASLTDLAASAGIRKASLYAHFKSKDALFLAAFETALAQERAYAQACFASEAAAALPGSHYCDALLQRFPASPPLQFVLRTGYMPPQALTPAIDAAYETYLAQLRDDFAARLQAGPWARGPALSMQLAECVEAYLGIVDSVQVRLIYTDVTQTAARLDALKQLLAAGLNQRVAAGGQP